MTGTTRRELERRLIEHLTEEVERLMATTDLEHQHELLQSRLRSPRRRRPPLYIAGLAAAVAAITAVTVVLATRSTGAHDAAPGAAVLPRPAASPLTVYRSAGNVSGSTVRVLSFLDTRDRWCIATLNSSTAPTPNDYTCRAAGLPTNGHGFGTVYGIGDAPAYDYFRSWFGGVATPDVARVTVVFGNGQVVPAVVRDQGQAHGIVFSLAWPTTTSNPAYYRAYAADGHLIQQVPVKQAVIAK